MQFETISAMQAVSYIGNPSVLFVDLREPSEYVKGHIPGALNLPYEDWERKKMRIPRNKIIIFYCDRGNTSLLAAREFAMKNYRVKSMGYGYLMYRGPVQKGH